MAAEQPEFSLIKLEEKDEAEDNAASAEEPELRALRMQNAELAERIRQLEATTIPVAVQDQHIARLTQKIEALEFETKYRQVALPGGTELFLAVMAGDVGYCQWFCARKLSIRLDKADITQMLCRAIHNKIRVVIDYCLENYLASIYFRREFYYVADNCVRSVLSLSVVMGDLPLLIKLLDKESQNLQIDHRRPSYYFSLARLAAHCGHLDMVRHFIEVRGVKVDEQTAMRGYTLLMDAAEKGHIDVVEYLIARGANIHLAERSADPKKPHPQDGLTALDWAAHKNHRAVVELLVQHGARLTKHSNDFARHVFFEMKYEQVLEETKQKCTDVAFVPLPGQSLALAGAERDRVALDFLGKVIEEKFKGIPEGDSHRERITLYAIICTFMQAYGDRLSEDTINSCGFYPVMAGLIRQPWVGESEAAEASKEEAKDGEGAQDLMNGAPESAAALTFSGADFDPPADLMFNRLLNPVVGEGSSSFWSSLNPFRRKPPEMPPFQPSSHGLNVELLEISGMKGSLKSPPTP